MYIHFLYQRLQLSSKLTLPDFFFFFFRKLEMYGVSPLKVDDTFFFTIFCFAFFIIQYSRIVLVLFYFTLFFIFTVLEELLNQYLMGGKEPSRRDLDHVFLRFGRKDLQFSFFGIKLRFYFYFIFYSFQFFYGIFVFLCFLF